MPKIALITGATSGIGEACAQQFAAAGYQLILLARREERLAAVASRLSDEYGVHVTNLVADVRSKTEVERVLASLEPALRDVDVLVNNAGLSQGLDPIDKGDPDDWDTMIDTNVKGLLYVTRVVSEWMVERSRGHIVNIGSIAAKEVYPNGNVYCATKHAVDALSKGMRVDLLPHGVKVTAIHPGMVETEFSIVRFKGDADRAGKVYEGLEPLVAEDIADAVFYAASRPPHVNINDLVIMPTAQATATNVIRSNS